MNQAVAGIRLNKDLACNEYVALFLNSFWGKMQFAQNRHDVGTPNINLEEIKEIKIVTPQTTDEQETLFNQHKKTMKETEPFLEKIKEIESKAEKELEKSILKR